MNTDFKAEVTFFISITVNGTFLNNFRNTQLIKRRNYPVEEHQIDTSDGYVLKSFRIPNPNQPGEVALIVHGLASSADDWITVGDSALPYYLNDNGFDVWLFNARGTRHSRKHRKLDPDKDASTFWNFSWDEIGLYDLPATINYILKITGKDKLYYVGHSQGGTSCLVLLSSIDEMNGKLTAAALLAPAAYFEDQTVLLKLSIILYSPNTHNTIFSEFPPKTIFFSNDLSKGFCSLPGIRIFCYNSIYFGNQLDQHPIDQKLIPVIVQHAPSTFSTKQIHHYTQIMESREFKRFNYGRRENLRKYGTPKPPMYNLSNIKVPMLLFYGSGDFLASPMSVKRLATELKNDHEVIRVDFDGFDHVDFLWARNVKGLIYVKILNFFKKFVSKNGQDD
ncbi:hypothetical protein ABEB36_006494 [Hypothenemus hampei]|uniref:Lipase n=1 Tax=Hypothenemus hampei TaxID=57062 RepID=A0ABD1EQR0_HYPHA